MVAWRQSPRHQQRASQSAGALLSELSSSNSIKREPNPTPLLAFVSPILMALRERTGRHYLVFRDELEPDDWRNLSTALRLQRAK
jgi:hypothetical protein